MESTGRQSVEIYFGKITDSVKSLAREIKYQSEGKKSLSGELRPALRELFIKYGIDLSDKSKTDSK